MSPTIQGVVFDMDGVLCGYDFELRLSHMAEATCLSRDFIRKVIWESEFDEEADRGIHSAGAYLKGCEDRLGVPFSRDTWVAARAAAMAPSATVLGLARAVAKRLPIALLTNNGLLLKETLPEVFPEVIEIFGERAFFSAELGLAKPDPAAFRAVAGHLAMDPEHVMFVDDSAAYVEGARKAGLYGYLFSNAQALRAELTVLGLL